MAASADPVTFLKANVALGFNSNGGMYPTTGAQSDSAQTADEVKTLYGNTDDAIDAANTPVPKLGGFKCIGWSAMRDGVVLPSPITFPVADTTYYATWAPVITITFNANEHGVFTGNKETLDIECLPGEKLTLPAEEALKVAPRYIFNGWFTEASGGTQVTDQTDCPASATTYYAQYTEEPTPDVTPASDTDTLPLTGDVSADLTNAFFAVPFGALALLVSGYSISRKRSL